MLSIYRFYLFFHVFNALYNFKNDDLKYITYFFICIMYIYMCTLLYNHIALKSESVGINDDFNDDTSQ